MFGFIDGEIFCNVIQVLKGMLLFMHKEQQNNKEKSQNEIDCLNRYKQILKD